MSRYYRISISLYRYIIYRTKLLTLPLRHRVSREETSKGFSSKFPRNDILYFSKGTAAERRYILRNAGSTAILFHRSPSMEHGFVSLCLGCGRVRTNKHWLVTALRTLIALLISDLAQRNVRCKNCYSVLA